MVHDRLEACAGGDVVGLVAAVPDVAVRCLDVVAEAVSGVEFHVPFAVAYVHVDVFGVRDVDGGESDKHVSVDIKVVGEMSVFGDDIDDPAHRAAAVKH